MELVGQRYVSSELTHFVGKGKDEEQQYQLLLKILKEMCITHPPHNLNTSGNLTIKRSSKISSNEMYSPEIVCFCDIPMADLSIHITKYSPFGLSFSKNFIVKHGGCPVFYIPQKTRTLVLKKDLEHLNYGDTPFDEIDKGDYFDEMLQKYHALMDILEKQILGNSLSPGVPDEIIRLHDLEHFICFHIFSYFKFYNHLCEEKHEDNFYLEREWRVIGNVKFTFDDIETIFMPKKYSQRFRNDCPLYMSQLIFIQ